MNLLATITNLSTALAAIPGLVSAAQTSLAGFVTFLNATL